MVLFFIRTETPLNHMLGYVLDFILGNMINLQV